MQNDDLMAEVNSILDTGRFNATYKLALLIALAAICREKSIGINEPLLIDYEQLAAQFVRLYWQSSQPYLTAEGDSRVLRQGKNSGQDKAIDLLQTFQTLTGIQSFSQINHASPHYRDLLDELAKLIRANPIKYLQSTLNKTVFYTEQADKGIRLLSGVGYFFQQNAAIIEQKCMAKWVDVVFNNPKNALSQDNYKRLAAILSPPNID